MTTQHQETNHNQIFFSVIKDCKKKLISKFGKSNTEFIFNIMGNSDSFLKSICLLPIWFNFSFGKIAKFSDIDLIPMANANLNAWIGYTLYDYLRDGKIKKEMTVTAISIANICVHDALLSFQTFLNKDFNQKDLLELFNQIDIFYIDSERKRLKKSKPINFKYICDFAWKKSIAASITALLIIPNNSKYKINYNKTLSFFKNYFTARQLSDDIDDYKKDLKYKIITPATVLLKEGFSFLEAKAQIRRRIDKNVANAKLALSNIDSFDSDYFIKKYVKAC